MTPSWPRWFAEADNAATLPKVKATSFHYALGKCFDDTGDYERAFPHFVEGGRLKRSGLNYEADETERVMERIAARFDASTFESTARQRQQFGRAGIRARHGPVRDYPDRTDHRQPSLRRTAPGNCPTYSTSPPTRRRWPTNDIHFPETMQGITQADLHLLGDRYLEGLQDTGTGVRHELPIRCRRTSSASGSFT